MDRKVLWQWLQKEFKVPRTLLGISLTLSIMANLGLMGWVVRLWIKSGNNSIEAEFIALSAGIELANTDIQCGRPRYLRIKIVDPSFPATWRFEPTEEIHEGLHVWEWSTDNDPVHSSVYRHVLVERYNRIINNVRTRGGSND